MAAPAIRLRLGDSPRLAAAQREAAGGAFAWVVFTSASGVRAWFRAAEAMGGDARPQARIAVVGTGTAEALREGGVEPDLIPPTFTTAALGEAFPEGSGRVLLPRADLATGELELSLVAKGWTPLQVDAYRIELEEGLPEHVVTALAEGRVDAVTFTSESTVTGFAGATAERPSAVCIGPVTAAAARREGFPVGGIAEPHTVDGLIDAVVGLLGPSGGG
jgi:uroporphyrinogen-III synthase